MLTGFSLGQGYCNAHRLQNRSLALWGTATCLSDRYQLAFAGTLRFSLRVRFRTMIMLEVEKHHQND